MKDFEKIDWKKFNHSPFYQQWLCIDETLKLATFGDKGLAELDDQILKLKDQWDLDNVNGYYLDRIGKLLNVRRNGNTDDFYRKLLILRTLLNTNDGTIPAIIKTIKFLYSSEVVHIVPDYPAGLIIEHDGEGTPGLNFNRLLEEMIPAGVSFSTKELFFFNEEFPSDDEFVITKVKKDIVDSFNYGTIKFNGRVKHDGYTLNSTEYLGFPANGTYKFNGEMKHGPILVPARTPVIIPIRPRRGIYDIFSIVSKYDFIDIFKTPLKHNGAIKANGSKKFNGIGIISDYLWVIATNEFSDRFRVIDQSLIKIDSDTKDSFTTHRKFNGEFKHDGAIKASAGRDVLFMGLNNTVLSDIFKTRAKHNGMIKANGKIKFDGITSIGDTLNINQKFNFQDRFVTTEKLNEKLRKDLIDFAPTQYKFDGRWKHNGLITPSATHDKLSFDDEAAIKDQVQINDEFFVGLRNVHRHDSSYRANGKIKFDSGIMVPV